MRDECGEQAPKQSVDGYIHPLLSIALRRQARGSGSTAAFLDRRTAWQAVPDVGDVLRDIPWAIVGGIALRAYMPERATDDLDILRLVWLVPLSRPRNAENK
jgi:hypothetical protein